MTEPELIEKRRAKWRLNGNPIQTLEDARAFLDDSGFSLMYPVRPPQLAPTLIGATLGADERLPTQQQAFNDPRAQTASELMIRLLRGRFAYETNTFADSPLLISASVFSYFYAMLTDRNPRQPPRKRGHEKASPLMVDTFEAIQAHGPLNKQQLRQLLRGDLSETAIDRALHDLWSSLKITRVDYSPDQGAFWDVLYRWAPEVVLEGVHISAGEALSALVSRYIECVVAAETGDIEAFFAGVAPKSRLREAINALLSAREFSVIPVDGRTLIGHPQPAGQRSQIPRKPRRPSPRQNNEPAMQGPGRDRDG